MNDTRPPADHPEAAADRPQHFSILTHRRERVVANAQTLIDDCQPQGQGTSRAELVNSTFASQFALDELEDFLNMLNDRLSPLPAFDMLRQAIANGLNYETYNQYNSRFSHNDVVTFWVQSDPTIPSHAPRMLLPVSPDVANAFPSSLNFDVIRRCHTAGLNPGLLSSLGGHFTSFDHTRTTEVNPLLKAAGVALGVVIGWAELLDMDASLDIHEALALHRENARPEFAFNRQNEAGVLALHALLAERTIWADEYQELHHEDLPRVPADVLRTYSQDNLSYEAACLCAQAQVPPEYVAGFVRGDGRVNQSVDYILTAYKENPDAGCFEGIPQRFDIALLMRYAGNHATRPFSVVRDSNFAEFLHECRDTVDEHLAVEMYVADILPTDTRLEAPVMQVEGCVLEKIALLKTNVSNNFLLTFTLPLHAKLSPHASTRDLLSHIATTLWPAGVDGVMLNERLDALPEDAFDSSINVKSLIGFCLLYGNSENLPNVQHYYLRYFYQDVADLYADPHFTGTVDEARALRALCPIDNNSGHATHVRSLVMVSHLGLDGSFVERAVAEAADDQNRSDEVLEKWVLRALVHEDGPQGAVTDLARARTARQAASASTTA